MNFILPSKVRFQARRLRLARREQRKQDEASASQVFAQTGGGSPLTVNVAVYVALEAKLGKEEAVD
jgi:hypothetical protein